MMDDPSFAIDTLNLRLPAGFAQRAESIAREVGQELSRLPLHQAARVAVLHVPGIQMSGGESDRMIAQRIARTIHRQVAGIYATQGLAAEGVMSPGSPEGSGKG